MCEFDEMYSRLPAAGDAGQVREHYQAYARWLQAQDPHTPWLRAVKRPK